MAPGKAKKRRDPRDKPPPNLKPEFQLTKEEEKAREGKKKKAKNAPDRPQPTWLHPPDEENPVLNPVIKSEEQKAKEKEEHDASINFLKRRAVGASEIPAPPGTLLNLVGGFLTAYGFDPASRLFTAQLDSRKRLGDWNVEYGKGLPSKDYPSLVRIFNDFHKQWELDHADDTSSSEDEVEESSDSDAADAKPTKAGAKAKVAKGKKKKRKGGDSDSDSLSDSGSDDVDDSMAAVNSTKPTSPDSESESESKPQAKPGAQAAKLTNGTSGETKTTASDYSSDSSSSDSSDSDSDSDSDAAPTSKPTTEVVSAEILNNASSATAKPALPIADDSDSSSDTSSSSSDSEPEPTTTVTVQDITQKPSKRNHSDSSITLEASPEKNLQPEDSSSDSDSSSTSDSSSDDDDEEADVKTAVTATVVTPSTTTTTTKVSSKRKLSESPPPATQTKKQKKDQTRFHRVDPNTAVDPRFASNKYQSYDYADKAHEDLIVTKGKGFTKEKNKKKRGAYKGGSIDVHGAKGIKFDD